MPFPLRLVFCTLLGCAPVAARAGAVAAPTLYRDDTLGLTIVSGEIRLPAEGAWKLVQPPAGSGLRQVFFTLADEEAPQSEGVRARANLIEETVRDAESSITPHYSRLKGYADQHGGRGPASLTDPDLLDLVANYGLPRNPAQTRPRDPEAEAEEIENFRLTTTGYGLVPDADLKAAPGDPFTLPRPVALPASPLLLELAPAVDDGKHWVLFTDGAARRVPVDTALLARLGLALSKEKVIARTVTPPTERVIRLHGSVTAGARGPVTLGFTDAISGRTERFTWDWSAAGPGTREQLADWARSRSDTWFALSRAGEAPLLRSWLAISDRRYGYEAYSNLFLQDQDAGRPAASLLALFGGRAAVQETLQLQQLAATEDAGANKAGADGAAAGVSLASIPGVEVKSHPFAEMVRGKSAPVLALADLVPPDRAFFQVSRPAELTRLFAPDSPLVRRLGAFVAEGNGYDLLERYSAELGLPRALTDALLDGGLIEECAVFTPDLFLADGTDVTVIVRPRSGRLLSKLLQPLLASLPGKDGIYTVPTARGAAHWATRGDLWFVSTHADELAASLDLLAKKGAGSLGRSEEFRYMLYKLPPGADTQAYVYFSDPFIRRLVGPAVKIAQLRRIRARLGMERLVGAALLRQLDVGGGPADKETLGRLGYLVTNDLASDFTIGPDFTVESAQFGPLGRMKPLSAQAGAMATVTAGEAAAYQRFLEGYSRFWSRYFDPIALRFDQAADHRQSITTFILPLVENTAYNQLREWLPAGAPTEPVLVPVFDRDPVARLDLLLPEKAWLALARSQVEFLGEHSGVSPRFYDLLGPALHVAVEDGDPIIRLGGGDLAGLFSSTDNGFGQGELLYLPVLLNLLTRPTHIAIGLSDPELAGRLLENARFDPAEGRNSWMQVGFHRQGTGREWILSLRPLGLASIDFSLRIEGKYLIISNHPFGTPLHIKASQPARLGDASITFHPPSLAASLPADFASAMETERDRTLAGMGHLYPWVLALGQTTDEALRANARTLGFTPALSAGVLNTQDGAFEHSVFGSAWQAKRLPAYDPQARFGIFDGIAEATIGLQFEEDGLRTELSWQTLPAPPAPAPSSAK